MCHKNSSICESEGPMARRSLALARNVLNRG